MRKKGLVFILVMIIVMGFCTGCGIISDETGEEITQADKNSREWVSEDGIIAFFRTTDEDSYVNRLAKLEADGTEIIDISVQGVTYSSVGKFMITYKVPEE